MTGQLAQIGQLLSSAENKHDFTSTVKSDEKKKE